MPFDDEGPATPRHWLCPSCRAPQSSALAICLECGSSRPAAPAAPAGDAPRHRVAFTSVLVGLMLVVTWLAATITA